MEHFEELLNGPVTSNPSNIEATPTDHFITVTPPTIEQIRMPIRQIKSEKEGGHDNISAEARQSDIEATAKMLDVLLRKIRKK